MVRSSTRNHRKRRAERDSSSSEDDSKRSNSRGPEKRSRRGERSRRQDTPDSPSTSNKNNEESLSIEETNKMRAQLGLAPLELDDQSKEREVTVDGNVEKVYKEDGMEFVHKKATHMGEKKKAEELKEKIQTMRDKRRLQEKLSRVKGLAESDSEEDTAAWVEKNRKLAEERKRAEERAKMLDEMDADFGVNAMLDEAIQKNMKKNAQKHRSDLAGLVVAHAKEDFMEGSETVLVLGDKGVLDEGEEVLLNPNLAENERHRKNAELRKTKGRYEPYIEELDEYGMPKEKGVLSKYDEELEGEAKKTFRLDEAGTVDISKEREEMEMKRKLMMANKKLETLDAQQYTVAREYYTQEEMLSFRKPKSKKEKKLRKRRERILKADDLVPDEAAQADDAERAAKAGARLYGTSTEKKTPGNGVKTESNLEEGELYDDEDKKDNWQAAITTGAVDIQSLNKFAKQVEDDEDDAEEDLVGGVDLSNVVIEDDAEEELNAMLNRARKLQQLEENKEMTEGDSALKVHEMMKIHQIKEEPSEEIDASSGVVIDSTMEYCRNLGEIPTYGLAGNRKDAIDMKELKELENVKTETNEGDDDLEDSYAREVEPLKRDEIEKKGKWTEAVADALTTGEGSSRQRSNSEESEEHTYNVLGEERDVSKGVAAMLKSAAEKGYLDTGKEKKVKGPSLKHLESKRFSLIETTRYDIEEKYTKKLERMGTTGTGPIRPFPEKTDYKPDIRITYVDERGKEMESKDAFRVLSWKFHGKGPGKKQIEKRQAKQEKKELMKKMNSMDTPLGTLNKQLKKQEALQAPYIILSGSGRDTGAPLKKE